MARGLKIQIQEIEGLYYPSSENKGADQLHGYREADLRLCFRICKKTVFSYRGSYVVTHPGMKHLFGHLESNINVTAIEHETMILEQTNLRGANNWKPKQINSDIDQSD